MAERRRRTIPPHAVDRPELRAQLDAGRDSPLSLVIAPAGAGKSVLLAQWAQAVRDRAVALLDITESDRDASVFARRLVDAVRAAADGFHSPAAPVETGGNRLGDAFLEDLASGFADAGPLIVIFDDVHWLSGTAVLADLWRLVDLLPASAHFVFSSRMDLQLGWSRHRLQHNLVEIRQRELAFDCATTARVIGAITGRDVDDETAVTVTAHTEGWAAGVHLTALSLRFTHDPERVVGELASDDRLVVDYLSEQVLGALDPDRRDALMKIAVLDEFCAPLLDAVLGGEGAATIAQLERESMFVLPLFERPGWHRFHRLFRDILLLRLRAHDPQAEAHALASAAQWCEAEGLAEEAIGYRLRARDWDGAIDGVLQLGRDLYGGTRMAAVVGWLAQVPAGVRAKRPAADLLLAIAQGMSGQAQIAVDELRGILSERELSAGERQAGMAYLAAFVQFIPHPEDFAEAARRALVMLRDEPHAELPDLIGLTTRPLLISVAQVSLGRALLLLGELDAARRILQDAVKGEGMAYRPYRVHALGSLALVEALSGRLVVAAGLADDALALTDESGLRAHPAPADAYLARAVAAIRRGEPDAGALALSEGLARASANNRTQLMWLAHLVSQIIEPDTLVAEAPDLPGPPPPFVRDALAALAMRRARLRGTPQHPPASARSWSLIAFEEIAGLLALGQPTAARARLAQLDEGTADAPTTAVECELLRGWTAALDGRSQQSRAHLQNALALAVPHRLVSPFVQAGPDVAELIDRLPGAADDFRRLVVLRGRAPEARRRQALVDKLTPRELELLAYLPSRLTFADIAAHSFVSINTVKTHVGHIYRKLGVTGRDAAIERAADLGLIDPNEIARVG